MWDMFKEASPLFKLQILFLGVMAVFAAYIGLLYLTGELQVEKAPPAVVIDWDKAYRDCMDSIKDYEDVRYDDAADQCAMIGSSNP